MLGVLLDVWLYIHVIWTLLLLHGSKVSRENDLRSVPYNRPVGVRSFVKKRDITERKST